MHTYPNKNFFLTNTQDSMKILFVIHDFLPSHQAGAEIYTYRLAKELSKNHEICLFFTEFTPLTLSYKATERTFNNLRCIEVFRPFKTDLLGEPYNDIKMETIFQTVLDEFKPDIIHLQHLLYHSFRYPEIAKHNNIPVLFTLHDYWLTCPRWGQRLQGNLEICHTVDWTKCADCLYEKPENSNRFTLQSFYHLFRQKISRSRTSETRINSLKERNRHILAAIENIDLFTAPSPFLRNEFIQYGIPEDKIIFSDNGFDTTHFKKHKHKKNSLVRFAFIGTLCEHKGVHVLIEAFNQVPENKAQLHIYGNLDWFPEYNSRLRKMVTSPAIFFEGLIPNDEIATILSEIDVLVVPSIWFENSPLTIHEAFMAGVPVITSDIGGMADLVTDGVNGLLFAVGDSTELTKAMMKYIESENLPDQLRNGIPAVKSIEENGREMEEIYHQLLKRTIDCL